MASYSVDPNQIFKTGGLTLAGSQPQGNLPAGPGQGYYGSQDLYKSGDVLSAQDEVNKSTPAVNTQKPSSGFPSNPNVNDFYNGYRWTGSEWAAPANQGIDENAINNVYQPTMNYLNQAEQAVRGDYPNVLDSAQKVYETAISELQGNKTKNLATVQESGVQATQRKEDALSAARRLFNEVRQGYRQRFGGASSASDAANTLAGVEQQRQQGQTMRDHNTTMRQIEGLKQQIETDYQTGSMKILESKNNAIAQAQRDFQNQLLSISAQRAQTEQAKAAAKLDALNTLRNQAYAAQQQALTYQQNLDVFYKQQQADLQTYAAKLAMYGQGATTAGQDFMNQTSTNPTTTLQTGSPNTMGGQSYTGQTSGRNWVWDATLGKYV